MARERNGGEKSLAEALAVRTGPAAKELHARLDEGKVRCFACGHRCLIPPGHEGICKVRSNVGGELRVPRGYVAGLQVDPIEKKPYFHAFPGAVALSFGMLGCDFHCAYCQNWISSQALRDPSAVVAPQDVDADHLVALALERGAPVMVSTYNEPLITSEWAVEVFQKATAAGITCGYVSNGNATDEVLDFIRPWTRLYKVDLKSFDDKSYRTLGGTLQAVLDTLTGLVRRGFWVEVVTLIVSGFNADEGHLREMARFLAKLSPDIPWHCTAFHPDYKMNDPGRTTAAQLIRACEIGREEGLRYCYAGNLPGLVGDWENTRCPRCQAMLIERQGYHVRTYRLNDVDGTCPDCGESIGGFWRAGWIIPGADGGLPGRIPMVVPAGTRVPLRS